jgi:hypothetical protein
VFSSAKFASGADADALYLVPTAHVPTDLQNALALLWQKLTVSVGISMSYENSLRFQRC